MQPADKLNLRPGGGGCDESNTQPAAACVLQGNFFLRRDDATKAMRGPQRRTHCGATKLLDPWLPRDGTFVVLVILVKYVVLLVLFVNYVICHWVTLCYMLCCYPRRVLLGNRLRTLHYWFYLLTT